MLKSYYKNKSSQQTNLKTNAVFVRRTPRQKQYYMLAKCSTILPPIQKVNKTVRQNLILTTPRYTLRHTTLAAQVDPSLLNHFSLKTLSIMFVIAPPPKDIDLVS